MSDTVIREVATGVWTFSRPFNRFGFFPVGGRSTAIKLSSGDVWVLASTPLNDETKTKLTELGPVKYIVSPDAEHHFFLAEFHKAYPEAKLIAVENVVNKKTKEGLKFAGFWADNAREPTFGFEDDIKACYFSGFKKRDVAFFHPASKSLIEADLVFNLPGTEQYSKSSSSGRIPFISKMNPYSGVAQSMAKGAADDKEAMKRDAKTVDEWDFERIIPCHGDVIENDGKKAWRAAYKLYLQS